MTIAARGRTLTELWHCYNVALVYLHGMRHLTILFVHSAQNFRQGTLHRVLLSTCASELSTSTIVKTLYNLHFNNKSNIQFWLCVESDDARAITCLIRFGTEWSPSQLLTSLPTNISGYDVLTHYDLYSVIILYWHLAQPGLVHLLVLSRKK